MLSPIIILIIRLTVFSGRQHLVVDLCSYDICRIRRFNDTFSPATILPVDILDYLMIMEFQ